MTGVPLYMLVADTFYINIAIKHCLRIKKKKQIFWFLRVFAEVEGFMLEFKLHTVELFNLGIFKI